MLTIRCDLVTPESFGLVIFHQDVSNDYGVPLNKKDLRTLSFKEVFDQLPNIWST